MAEGASRFSTGEEIDKLATTFLESVTLLHGTYKALARANQGTTIGGWLAPEVTSEFKVPGGYYLRFSRADEEPLVVRPYDGVAAESGGIDIGYEFELPAQTPLQVRYMKSVLRFGGGSSLLLYSESRRVGNELNQFARVEDPSQFGAYILRAEVDERYEGLYADLTRA